MFPLGLPLRDAHRARAQHLHRASVRARPTGNFQGPAPSPLCIPALHFSPSELVPSRALSFVLSPPFGESFLSLFFIVPLRSLTEGRLLRKPSAETQELEQRLEPDNLRSPSPGPCAGGWLSISLTMRPPRSAPVPGLIIGLRLLRRRPLPLHIPTRSDLSGWRPLRPKVKGCPAPRGGISGANRLTGFSAVQPECASDTPLCGDSPPASGSLGVACMEGG